ncbi:MAG: glycoside hydrolase family 28 protein [Acidobacteriota bacterium]|nr:MAG: glycoside hydrolase family 28 protein [Acidobacteriota bacterium]
MGRQATKIPARFGLLFCVFILASGPSEVHAQGGPGWSSVFEFGARPDGVTLNTKAIQEAIDARSSSGGGTVYFPPGTYLSGTIVLRSHVTLLLDAGAVLLGSPELKDYPVTIPAYRSYTDNYTERSLIYAENAENIAILGRGTVDGQGAAFKDRKTPEDPYKLRPYMIRFIQCRDVTVRDVTLRNSPMWVQHYLACDDVLIEGITVDSIVAGNNDGIDIDSCHRVRISNCDIRSGDDAIVLKATSDRACRDVTVTNSVLKSDCNAFKLGTESNGGFQNITFSNSTIYDTGLAAIALEMVDGGTLDQVLVDNIVIRNAGTAIFLRLGNRARPFLARGPGGSRGTWERREGLERPGMGSFRRVSLRNIQARGIDATGCSISGLPGHPIEEVSLENIRVTFAGGGKRELVDRAVPEVEEGYPEYKMFGMLPAYGFYVRHAAEVRFEQVEVDFETPDERPAFFFDDVGQLALVDVAGQLAAQAPALLLMKGVEGALISHCRPDRSIGTFLYVDKSRDISIMNNVFSNVREVFRAGAAMETNEVFLASNRE